MQNIQRCGQRISVVGTSGSGKTTLARQVASYLQVPHIELDALHWEPNWAAVSDQVFRERVAAAVKGERWVIDGNYSKVRNLIWSRADTVIFLDYSFWVVLQRLLQRTLQRSLKQEELWNGNRETLQKAFFNQDSVLLWMLQTYRVNRKKYPALFQMPEFQHLSVIHLRSPQIAEQLLSDFAANSDY
jgi:adenylate kinase family enzyme